MCYQEIGIIYFSINLKLKIMNQNEKIAINLAFNFALLVFNFSVARDK